MNQRLITKILDLWNCSFDLVNNGQEAVEISKKRQYDMILMDVHMPVMDGIESAKLIRSDKANPNHETPIIALTAAALLDERNRVFEVGMNDFLTKPFSPSTLEKTIVKWLDEPETFAEIKLEKTTKNTVEVSLNYLRNFSGNDIDFMQEMIQMFLNGMPAAVVSLKKYQTEHNWEMVYKTAHKMKPNFMMMGMKSQEKAAENIELLTNEKVIDTEQLVKIIDSLEKDVEIAYPFLKNLSDKLKS